MSPNEEPIETGSRTARTETAYKVGFCRPPLAHRFKKGRSGNPKGRPKARTDIGALLSEALDERIEVKIGGTERKFSMEEAIVASLVNRAIQNDPRALRSFLKLAAKGGKLKPPAQPKNTGVLVVGQHAD
jgi:hypothetical protein